MQHPQVSPRVKTHSHLTFSAVSATNDIFFNDYSLEPRKPTPKKAIKDVTRELGRQNQSIPVLKSFHKVVKTEEAPPEYLFNSERGKQLVQMNVVHKPEVIPKPAKVMKFIRHPHKSHSTKIMPRVEEEPVDENKMKSINEIMIELEEKENEIKQLQQTNQKMKKEIATFSVKPKDLEARKVQDKLEKYEKIIQIYSKLLNSCSNVSSHSDFLIIDTAVQESELPKPERRKIVQNKNKRGSLEVYVKDASELYYNETGSTENLAKAKLSTAPDLNCNLQTKTSLHLNCEAFEEKSANFQVELKTPTSITGFYSARESTSKPGKVKRNFVLRRCESKSKIKFNLTTVSSDTCDEIKTDRGGKKTPIEFKKEKSIIDNGGEQQLKRKNSSMENTRDTIKNEKNSFNCQELNGIGEKLTRIMTMYQLEEEKMMKKIAEIIKKLESLKSKPIY